MIRRQAPALVALAVCLVLAGAFWLVAVAAPAFFFGYEWPSIKGNGPEDLTSLLLVTAVTGLLYPPVRRWIAAELDHLHAKADHTADLLHHLITHTDGVPERIGGVHISSLRPARGRPVKGAPA